MDDAITRRRGPDRAPHRLKPDKIPFVQIPNSKSWLLASATVLTTLLGCSTTPSKPSLMANMAQEDVSVAQLRALDYEYAAHFGQTVSTCVLDIVDETDDLEALERAYQWRMWAAAQARAASFDHDPFAGMLELWVLAGQQSSYFAEGGGTQAFGDQQQLAIATTRKLEEDIRAVASKVMEPETFASLSKKVDEWIGAHPIEGRLFVRPTARADLAGLVSEEKQGGLKAVGSIEETFRDLNDRITILTVQMPTEARWQAEYLTNSLFEERLERPTNDLIATMANMNDFLDTFEQTVDEQVATLLEAVERERLAIFEAVAEERKMVLSAVEQERISVLKEVDTQIVSATTEFDRVGKGLIDHFFHRLIQVMVVMGIVVFLIVLLVLYVGRRRSVRTIDRTPPSE